MKAGILKLHKVKKKQKKIQWENNNNNKKKLNRVLFKQKYLAKYLKKLKWNFFFMVFELFQESWEFYFCFW